MKATWKLTALRLVPAFAGLLLVSGRRMIWNYRYIDGWPDSVLAKLTMADIWAQVDNGTLQIVSWTTPLFILAFLLYVELFLYGDLAKAQYRCCTNCRYPLQDTDRMCPECGRHLDPDKERRIWLKHFWYRHSKS